MITFKSNCYYVLTLLATSLFVVGCHSYETRVANSPGRPTRYFDTTTSGPVAGVGIESQDVNSMADKMVRSMLSNRILAGQSVPPRIMVDASHFQNQGSSRINLNMITDAIRHGLIEYAQGRLRFISSESTLMVEQERTIKRQGVTDTGTLASQSQNVLGVDYILRGRITTLDSVQANTGMTSRYHQIVFEMVDSNTREIVWGGTYKFGKAGADDVIYR